MPFSDVLQNPNLAGQVELHSVAKIVESLREFLSAFDDIYLEFQRPVWDSADALNAAVALLDEPSLFKLRVAVKKLLRAMLERNSGTQPPSLEDIHTMCVGTTTVSRKPRQSVEAHASVSNPAKLRLVATSVPASLAEKNLN